MISQKRPKNSQPFFGMAPCRFLIVLAFCLHIQIPKSWAADAVPNVENDVTELTKVYDQNQAAYKGLNQINPISSDFQKGQNILANPGGMQSVLPPGLANNPALVRIQAFLNHPSVQALFQYFSSPKFIALSEQLLKNENIKALPYNEVGWLILFIFFRAWRSSKLSSFNWIRRIWLSLWTMVLYLGVGSFVIPWALLGDPYHQIVSDLVQVFIKHK